MKRINAYIMFTDIKNFSKLDESQLSIFAENIWPEAFEVFVSVAEKTCVFNTWGDAILMVFESPDAVQSILRYRDYFRTTDFDGMGLPPLAVRIGCHFGSFYIFDDPVIGRPNVIGGNINTAARIEPVTRPNNIYVTQEFKSNFTADRSPDKPRDVEFDEIGDIPLAKNFGSQHVYLLRTSREDKHIIDRLIQQDLIEALPTPRKMTEDEQDELESYEKMLPEHVKQLSDSVSLKADNSEYLMEFVGLCIRKGLYDKAIEKAELLEQYTIDINEVEVHPYKSRVKFQKDKANALTRLGRYQESAEIMYGLWTSGVQDSDTLCMLAAQYKRRALYNEDGQVQPKESNRHLLERARDLYLEAFRRDITNYYSAINAAYLGVILGGDDSGKGRSLANYIITAWKSDFG